MMELVYALAAIGLTFNLLGGLGIIRFPDVYTRLHAATLCTTFGVFFIVAAIVAYSAFNWNQGSTIMVSHSIIAALALFVANPTAAHAIARAAHRSGIMPKHASVDSYREAGK